jgi:ribosome maturation factor RimP
MARTTPTQQRLADEIRSLADEVVAGTSYFVVDVEVRGHKGTRVVEIYVDGDDGIGHDDLAVVSKEVGFLLDVEDTVAGSYKLEVSSPGIKRPLSVPRQYMKNVGRTLRVRYQLDGSSRDEIVVGELTDADEDEIELKRSSDERLRLPYAAVTEARVELPW